MTKKLAWASSTAIALALMVVAVAAASGVLTNGDFETGDLTGWGTYVTPNGVSAGGINVVHFQTTTTEVSGSQAVQMKIGQVVFTPGVREGAGISQSFSLASSADVSVSANVAIQAHGWPIGGAALFELMIDDVVIDSFSAGPLAAWQIERDDLVAEVPLSAGIHEIKLQVTQAYLAGASSHYIDNVDVMVLTMTKADVLAGSGVPGAGVGDAPGLQKEFNEKSRAGEKAGKK